MSAAPLVAVDRPFAEEARARWHLTPRETQIAWLMARGVWGRADLAARLGISLHTIKHYRASMRRKMAGEVWEADHNATLMAAQARDVFERTAPVLRLDTLADDLEALARICRGVMTYRDGEDPCRRN